MGKEQPPSPEVSSSESSSSTDSTSSEDEEQVTVGVLSTPSVPTMESEPDDDKGEEPADEGGEAQANAGQAEESPQESDPAAECRCPRYYARQLKETNSHQVPPSDKQEEYPHIDTATSGDDKTCKANEEEVSDSGSEEDSEEPLLDTGDLPVEESPGEEVAAVSAEEQVVAEDQEVGQEQEVAQDLEGAEDQEVAEEQKVADDQEELQDLEGPEDQEGPPQDQEGAQDQEVPQDEEGPQDEGPQDQEGLQDQEESEEQEAAEQRAEQLEDQEAPEEQVPEGEEEVEGATEAEELPLEEQRGMAETPPEEQEVAEELLDESVPADEQEGEQASTGDQWAERESSSESETEAAGMEEARPEEEEAPPGELESQPEVEPEPEPVSVLDLEEEPPSHPGVQASITQWASRAGETARSVPQLAVDAARHASTMVVVTAREARRNLQVAPITVLAAKAINPLADITPEEVFVLLTNNLGMSCLTFAAGVTSLAVLLVVTGRGGSVGCACAAWLSGTAALQSLTRASASACGATLALCYMPVLSGAVLARAAGLRGASAVPLAAAAAAWAALAATRLGLLLAGPAAVQRGDVLFACAVVYTAIAALAIV